MKYFALSGPFLLLLNLFTTASISNLLKRNFRQENFEINIIIIITTTKTIKTKKFKLLVCQVFPSQLKVVETKPVFQSLWKAFVSFVATFVGCFS